MFLPLTPGLKIHCFENAGGIIEGHLPLKLLSFTQNGKEAARMEWFTSKFCPKTSSFQQKTIENSHLSQSSWTERNHNQDPTQMAGECQERGEKPGFLLQETGKIIARSFSEPVSKSDDETLLCLAGLALFLFFPACTACELVT